MLSAGWSLLPLAIGSALLPTQIFVTVLLLRSSRGLRTALAWVVGITAARFLQGILFGAILAPSTLQQSRSNVPGPVASALLLAAAVVFYVAVLRQIFAHGDEDAPPPRWMAMVQSMSAVRAFLLGAGMLLFSVKFWVLTLGAVGVIQDAHLRTGEAVIEFALFAGIAVSVLVVFILATAVTPQRARGYLDRVAAWLLGHDRLLVIVLGLIFGTWFMVTALRGLGVL